MKILNVDTKFRWRILEPCAEDEDFVGVCDRLKITAQASTIEELIDVIQENTNYLFKDLCEHNDLNEYAFKREIAYKINDYEKYVDVAPLPVIIT